MEKQKKTKPDHECDSCSEWGEWKFIDNGNYKEWIRLCRCGIITQTTFSEPEQPIDISKKEATD